MVQETDDILKFDEHVKVEEEVVTGPHGTQTVIVSIDRGLHVEEKIKKHEEIVCEDSRIDHHHRHPSQRLAVAESASEKKTMEEL